MFMQRTRVKFFKSKLPLTLALSAILLISVALSGQTVQADEDSMWLGVFRHPEQGLIKIDMDIGEDGNYFLHYGVPRSCRMELEELMETKEQILLKVKETSGGICDDWYQADVIITKDSSTAWTATIEKSAIDFMESYQLLRE